MIRREKPVFFFVFVVTHQSQVLHNATFQKEHHHNSTGLPCPPKIKYPNLSIKLNAQNQNEAKQRSKKFCQNMLNKVFNSKEDGLVCLNFSKIGLKRFYFLQHLKRVEITYYQKTFSLLQTVLKRPKGNPAILLARRRFNLFGRENIFFILRHPLNPDKFRRGLKCQPCFNLKNHFITT
jgi:hypothetical protein